MNSGYVGVRRQYIFLFSQCSEGEPSATQHRESNASDGNLRQWIASQIPGTHG
jgi:hypothetical protein